MGLYDIWEYEEATSGNRESVEVLSPSTETEALAALPVGHVPKADTLGRTRKGSVPFNRKGKGFDASSQFPDHAEEGDVFRCTVAGTLDGETFAVGDHIHAVTSEPSTTLFSGNWDRF